MMRKLLVCHTRGMEKHCWFHESMSIHFVPAQTSTKHHGNPWFRILPSPTNFFAHQSSSTVHILLQVCSLKQELLVFPTLQSILKCCILSSRSTPLLAHEHFESIEH